MNIGILKKVIGCLQVVLILLFNFAPLIHANPTGENVVSGLANFERSGNTLKINQSSDRVIINWRNFSIGGGEHTNFLQPSTTSVALNRVISGNPSQILGTLSSNGRVFVINPNGIFVGGGAMVNCGAFVGATLDVKDKQFKGGGDLNFAGNSKAKIENRGTINAIGGDIYLIARKIENKGVLSAPQGKVGLAAGMQVLLTEAGDKKLFVKPMIGARSSSDVGIDNAGIIQAAQVELRATGNLYALAINNSGIIRANGFENKGGHVFLTANGGNIKSSGTLSAKNADGSGGKIVVSGGHNDARASTVSVSGTLDASGKDVGTKGGEIQVLGDRVGLEDETVIDASGDVGGGKINIGGNQQGQGPLQNAEAIWVSPDATISADAISNGNGGDVILYADNTARIYGDISARGGANGGNGGFVETSGKESFEILNTPDVSAPAGSGGTWLIDPRNLQIVAGNGSSGITITPGPTYTSTSYSATLGVNNVNAALNSGISVVIQTGSTGLLQLGNLSMASGVDIQKTSGGNASLQINAHNDATLNSITSSSGKLSITINADSDNNNWGLVTLNGDLISNGGAIDISGRGVIQSFSSTVNAGNGKISVDPKGGSVALFGAMTTDNASSSALVLRNASFAMIGNLSAPNGTVALGEAGGGQIKHLTLQSAGTAITANKLIANTGGAIALDGNNKINTLGDVTRGGYFYLKDVSGGLIVNGALTGGSTDNSVTIDTSGGALAINGNITGNRVSLAGVGVTQKSSSTVDAGSGDILINAKGGTIDMRGLLTTFSASSTAIVLQNASKARLGDLSAVNGTVVLGQSGANKISGNIRQNSGKIIRANQLTAFADGSIKLTHNNEIDTLGDATRGGAFDLKDVTGGLIVDGPLTGGLTDNSVTIKTQGGALKLRGDITGNRVKLVGEGVTQTSTSTVDARDGEILVDANDGAIDMHGTLKTASSSATAVVLRDVSSAALGNIFAVNGTVVLGQAGGNNISGNVSQNAGKIIKADTLTANTGGSIKLTQNNRIDTLGSVIRGGAFSLKDVSGGLIVKGPLTGGDTDNSVTIDTSGGVLAMKGNITGNQVNLLGDGITQNSSSVVDAGKGRILVDAKDGVIDMHGLLTTTSSSSLAVVLQNASRAKLGDISAVNGTVVLGRSGANKINGKVSQNPGKIITANKLAAFTGGAIQLNHNNQIGTLGSVTRGGAFNLRDVSGGLIVEGPLTGGLTDNSVKIKTAGGPLMLLGDITGRRVSLSGDGVFQLFTSAVKAGKGGILVDANGGFLALLGMLRTTSASSTAVVLREGSLVLMGGNIFAPNGTVVLGQAGGGEITGPVVQFFGGKIVADTLTANTTDAILLTGDNQINILGDVTRGGDFVLNDVAGGLIVNGSLTAGLTDNRVEINASGGVLALNNNITGNQVNLSGFGVTQASTSIVDAGAGDILVDAGDGSVDMQGGLTTTSGSATAVVIRNATDVALGNITALNGTLNLGTAGNSIHGDVAQNIGTAINADTLAANTEGSIVLNNPANTVNTVASIQRGGDFGLNDSADGIVINGPITAGTINNDVTIVTAGGDLTLSGFIATSGAGNNVVLATDENFINTAGAAAIATSGGGRYLIYSTDPALNTRGGLSFNFQQYSTVYPTPPNPGNVGNGFLYSVAAPPPQPGFNSFLLNSFDAIDRWYRTPKIPASGPFGIYYGGAGLQAAPPRIPTDTGLEPAPPRIDGDQLAENEGDQGPLSLVFDSSFQAFANEAPPAR